MEVTSEGGRTDHGGHVRGREGRSWRSHQREGGQIMEVTSEGGQIVEVTSEGGRADHGGHIRGREDRSQRTDQREGGQIRQKPKVWVPLHQRHTAKVISENMC